MSENTQQKTDQQYQQALDEALEQLQQCQTNKNLSSCMQCIEVLKCNTRDYYVKAVYDSMNKGQGGGFEF